MRDNGLYQSVMMDIDELDEIENGIDGSLAKFARASRSRITAKTEQRRSWLNRRVSPLWRCGPREGTLAIRSRPVSSSGLRNSLVRRSRESPYGRSLSAD